MSYAAPYDEIQAPAYEHPRELVFIPRSRHQWMPIALAVLFCGLSWMMGGIPRVTDLGFTLLSLTCLVFTISEFARFPQRFGLGGLLLYGGVLVWFSHDYFYNWFGRDYNGFANMFRAVTIAKAAFYYSLFILFMTLGLRTGGGKVLQRMILSVPEPSSETFYFVLMLLILAFGLSPFLLFSYEPFLLSLYHGAFSAWTESVKWTVGRTGNLNYDWGGYVAQIIQAGEVGGIFASLFAILISTRLWSKVVAWTIWLFWTLFTFNGGRRGELAFMVLPPIALLFIKYQARVAMSFRKFSWKAYAICGVLGFVLLVAVQAEGTFRGVGLNNVDVTKIDLVESQGNSMFTEGLLGYQLIPDEHPFFANRFPGEGFIRALPEQFAWLVIGPIPRALWRTKPVDELWEWYNKVVTGDSSGRVGTTISKGLVGTWYFHYGFWGVVEGGFLVGWLMGVVERCLQHSGGRPMSMLMSLGLAVWLFRLYRDFGYVELYTFGVGALVLWVLIHLSRPFLGGSVARPSAEPAASSNAPEMY